MLTWTDEKLGSLIVNIAISIGKYANKNLGGLDIIANYSGQEGTLKTLDEIENAIAQVEKEIQSLGGHPGEYLRDMMKSHRALLRVIKNDGITYKEAIKEILQIDLQEISNDRYIKLQHEIDKELTEQGYTGKSVNEMVNKWFKDTTIDPDNVINTSRKYISLLQKGARKIVDMPDSEGVGKLDSTHDVFWAALSQYQGSYVTNVTFNIDNPWREPVFIDTLSHELYPGHHTWYTRQEYLFRNNKFPMEATYVIADMPSNPLFEGTPESGIEFIGVENLDVDTEGFDKALKRKVILAKKIVAISRIVQMNGCYRYNVLHESKDDVIKYMAKDGWMDESTANRIYNYFSHPINGLYYPSYFYGRWIVKYAYEKLKNDKINEFYKNIYDTPHTVRTFINEVERLTGEPFDPVKMAQSNI